MECGVYLAGVESALKAKRRAELQVASAIIKTDKAQLKLQLHHGFSAFQRVR